MLGLCDSHIYADRHVRNDVPQDAFQASASNVPSLWLSDALLMSLRDPFLDDRHSLDHQTGGLKSLRLGNTSKRLFPS
jgi:hypothetical protein